MRLILAVWFGKIVLILTRLLKNGGSAAPGLYALKIDPKLVDKLSLQIPRTIIITGTNGKTTTSKLLANFAHENSIRVIRNATGSNLERGIASSLIKRANLLGNIKNIDVAIWETDEAAFNKVAPKVNPSIVVFLNALRDQLDRYGEVDSVVEKWAKTIEKLQSGCVLILNRDDENIARLNKTHKGESRFFGVEGGAIKGESKDRVSKEKCQILAFDIKSSGLEGTKFQLQDGEKIASVDLPIPGIYHVYDFLASYSVGQMLGVSSESMLSSLETYTPAFGRVEKINYQNKEIYILLIKNPTGATQVLKTLVETKGLGDGMFIVLNDNYADGTDVSWIWDSEFELLSEVNSPIYCSGTRVYDLGLRLKYAGIKASRLHMIEDFKEAAERVLESKHKRIFILPTYTALLQLQSFLEKRGVVTDSWRRV